VCLKASAGQKKGVTSGVSAAMPLHVEASEVQASLGGSGVSGQVTVVFRLATLVRSRETPPRPTTQ